MAFKVPFGKEDHKIRVQPRLTELDRRREGPNDHGECKDLLKPEGELSVPSSYIFFSWDVIGHCLPYLVKFYQNVYCVFAAPSPSRARELTKAYFPE